MEIFSNMVFAWLALMIIFIIIATNRKKHNNIFPRDFKKFFRFL